jgi:hypothetical protein
MQITLSSKDVVHHLLWWYCDHWSAMTTHPYSSLPYKMEKLGVDTLHTSLTLIDYPSAAKRYRHARLLYDLVSPAGDRHGGFLDVSFGVTNAIIPFSAVLEKYGLEGADALATMQIVSGGPWGVVIGRVWFEKVRPLVEAGRVHAGHYTKRIL